MLPLLEGKFVILRDEDGRIYLKLKGDDCEAIHTLHVDVPSIVEWLLYVVRVKKLE